MQTHNQAGSVTLRSANPREVPDIVFNQFAQGREQDIGAMVEGFEFVRSVFRMPDQDYGPYTYVQPGPDEAADESIDNGVYSHHAIGTCIMGPDDDENACVDSHFRVRGVTGLRVVDGSVFPRVPGAFPVLPTFMLAEKAMYDILRGIS